MSGRGSGWIVGVALLAAGARVQASEEIRPGLALPAPTAEAAQYEALLQGQAVPSDDTVEKRRQFTDHPLRVGVGLEQMEFTPLTGLALELDVWDRLAVGAEGRVSFWGWQAGGYLRVRPIVWGGLGRNALHALTLQGSYRYMAYGEDYLLGLGALACEGDCNHPHYLPAAAHFLTLDAGFEHALWSGWTVRYAVGAAFLVQDPDWRCEELRAPVDCGSQPPPPSVVFVNGFVISHALF